MLTPYAVRDFIAGFCDRAPSHASSAFMACSNSSVMYCCDILVMRADRAFVWSWSSSDFKRLALRASWTYCSASGRTAAKPRLAARNVLSSDRDRIRVSSLAARSSTALARHAFAFSARTADRAGCGAGEVRGQHQSSVAFACAAHCRLADHAFWWTAIRSAVVASSSRKSARVASSMTSVLPSATFCTALDSAVLAVFSAVAASLATYVRKRSSRSLAL